jgi:hypothetical protein
MLRFFVGPRLVEPNVLKKDAKSRLMAGLLGAI